MTNDFIPQVVPNLVLNKVAGELVIIKPSEGKVASLNKTATQIFSFINAKTSVAQIIAKTQELYPKENAKDIAKDVEELLKDLLQKNIISK